MAEKKTEEVKAPPVKEPTIPGLPEVSKVPEVPVGQTPTIEGPAAEVAIPESNAVATLDPFAEESDLGFEEADRDAFSIPFLVILQKGSPQVDKDDPNYIKGAEPGHFFNTVAKEVYDGKKGITVIPCAYQRRFIEWTPREKGGGYKGEHLPENVDVTALVKNKEGQPTLNGNNMVDTRYHFCVHLTEEGPKFVLVTLSSTQIKASRNWMSAMKDKRVPNPKTGQLQSLPMMAYRWKLTTVTQSNDKGSWKGFNAEFENVLEFPKDTGFYEMARAFHDQVTANKVVIERAESTESENTFF